MIITKQYIAEQINNYLQHKIKLEDLVDWAENAMMEGSFDERHFEEIREVLSYLGLADTRAFGLQLEDCERLLNKLDYAIRIEIVKVA